MTDSKENYNWELGSEKLKRTGCKRKEKYLLFQWGIFKFDVAKMYNIIHRC